MSKRFRANETSGRDKRVQTDSSHFGKIQSETKCPQCGLLFLGGVWKRSNARIGVPTQLKLCPACTQVRQGVVGGVVELSGTFAASHRQELLNRIHNVGSQTAEGRPLERIISIQEKNGHIIVSATTEHLAARIGKAIHRDFGGNLVLKYAPEEKYATARWCRDL